MDFKKLKQWLLKNGYHITARDSPNVKSCGGGHMQLWTRDWNKVTQWPTSPQREGPAVKNYIALLRRRGIDVPRKGEKW